jgi:biofilm PGA synthesis N-glycosyltransferase PgaC
VLVPVVLAAARRKELKRALLSFPCFYPLRLLNAVIMLTAAFRELVLRRPLLVYEKGH